MKKLLTLAFSLFCFLGMAQSVSMDQINKEAKTIAKKYKFNKEQKAQLTSLIVKKYEDLAKVETLRDGDVKVYRQKLRAIHTGTKGSIELLLDTNNGKQMARFKKEMKKQRIENAEKVQFLTASNADMEDIKDAEIGLHN